MSYVEDLCEELSTMRKKLQTTSKEGARILKFQIKQIERDIRRYSTSGGDCVSDFSH